ncbi:tetratricopeptide repeat protein [Neosynechococcus sphagnicola]|uniref:tetratricopeptide repeat protein n=1 Tax=Neosynechococcus sphagnicola TaxID=1501145 RepID=UPI00195524E9|nr:tetratricopeptide repeat protein [Neosynechococcus sphagnicola]
MSSRLLLLSVLSLVGCTALTVNQPAPTPTASLKTAAAAAPSAQAITLNNQGARKVQKGKYQGAIADFSQAIHLSPQFTEAYLGRGIAYSMLGKHPAAIQNFDQAIQLQPNFAPAYLNRADDYQQLGQSQRAIADLQKAIQLFTTQGDQKNASLAQQRLALLQNPGQPNSPAVAVAARPTPGMPTPTMPAPVEPLNYEAALASHLRKVGATMFATYWCPYCRRQEQLFGAAVSQLNIVECDPNGTNAQPALCEQKGVHGYPTWEINGQIFPGMLSLRELADLSGFQR